MNLRTISSYCGLAGSISGAAIGYLHIERLAKANNIELSNWLDQLSYPLLTVFGLFVYLMALMFICAFICHLPFVILKKITLKEAFKSVVSRKKLNQETK